MSNQKSEKQIKEEEERRRKSEEKEKQESVQKEKKKKEEKGKKKNGKGLIDDIIINIPILILETPEIMLKEMEVDKEIPEIEEEETEAIIPKIRKEKSKVNIKNDNFDITIPTIKAQNPDLVVPYIKLKKPKFVRVKGNFNDRIPQIISKMIKPQRIPKYKIERKKKLSTVNSSFDNSIDNLLLEKLIGLSDVEEIEEKIKDKTLKEQVTESQEDFEGGIPSGGMENPDDLPDIIDYIFNISSRELSRSKRPKLVLYKELDGDSTIGFFTTICLKIMREKGIRNPKVLPMKKLDEFNTKEIEKYIIADRKIIIIDIGDYDKEINESKKWFIKENLMELIRKCIHGEFGLIIFKTRSPELYKHCEKVLINLEREVENNVEIVYLKPNLIENKKEVVALLWGNIELEGIDDDEVNYSEDLERLTGMGIFDDINKKAEAKYEQILEGLEEEDRELYINATNPHKSGESDEHKQLKWFIVKVLTLSLIENEVLTKKSHSDEIKAIIRTEDDTREEKNGPIADVKYENTVYEAETFYAQDVEGKKPTEKINYTINKYKEERNIKIKIILENLTMLRHLKKLVSAKIQKSPDQKEKIEFLTLDLQNNELISLGEIIKRLKKIQNKCSSKEEL